MLSVAWLWGNRHPHTSLMVDIQIGITIMKEGLEILKKMNNKF